MDPSPAELDHPDTSLDTLSPISTSIFRRQSRAREASSDDALKASKGVSAGSNTQGPKSAAPAPTVVVTSRVAANVVTSPRGVSVVSPGVTTKSSKGAMERRWAAGSSSAPINTDGDGLPFWKIAAAAAYGFGQGAYVYTVSIIMQPNHIGQIVGTSRQQSAFNVLVAWSGIVTIVLSIYFGAFNDASVGWTKLGGRRRPWIVLGVAVMCASLWFLNGTKSLVIYSVVHLVHTIGVVLATTSFHALLADIVPASQNMTISTIVSAFFLAGSLHGVAIASFSQNFGEFWAKLFVSATLCLSTAITVATTFEPTREGGRGVSVWSMVSPGFMWRKVCVGTLKLMSENDGFRTVCTSRFWMQLAIATIGQLLLSADKDCSLIPSPFLTSWPSILYSLATAAALCVLVPAFHVQEHRKRVIYASSAIFVLALISIFIAIVPIPAAGAVAVFLLAFSYGPYTAVEFDMALDTIRAKTATPARRPSIPTNGPARGRDDTDSALTMNDSSTLTKALAPSLGDLTTITWDDGDTIAKLQEAQAGPAGSENGSNARNLAVWTAALTLPRVFAAPLAGMLTEVFHGLGGRAEMQCFGYTAVTISVGLYWVAGLVAAILIPDMN